YPKSRHHDCDQCREVNSSTAPMRPVITHALEHVVELRLSEHTARHEYLRQSAQQILLGSRHLGMILVVGHARLPSSRRHALAAAVSLLEFTIDGIVLAILILDQQVRRSDNLSVGRYQLVNRHGLELLRGEAARRLPAMRDAGLDRHLIAEPRTVLAHEILAS